MLFRSLAGSAASAPPAQGGALASAGGVGAAIAAVKIARAGDAQRQAVAAFAATPAAGLATLPAAGRARPAPPDQPRVPLSRSGLPTAASSAGSAAAPVLPQADPRSTAYGFGVPLKPRLGAGRGAAPTSGDPAVPHWVALAVRASSAASATSRHGAHRRGCACLACRCH